METISKERFIPSPAQAYWNQRVLLSENHDRILALSKAVNRPSDLLPYQMAQLMAFAMEFAPDIILELGRGVGNSTCAFTQVAEWLKPHECNVLSLCLSDDWTRKTVPRLRKIVSEKWFQPLQALQSDILTFNYKTVLSDYNKILVFWDAHGFDVAECVLGGILPCIVDRPHVVIMHDLSDARYLSPSTKNYGENGLWKGNNWDGPRLRIGNIDTAVEQAVAIMDFTIRNSLKLHSADHSFHTELGDNLDKLSELQNLLTEDLFSLSAHWFWFSLNEGSGPYTFPRFQFSKTAKISKQGKTIELFDSHSLKTRLKLAIKILLYRYPIERFLL